MSTPTFYIRNLRYLALCCDCKELFTKEYVEFKNELPTAIFDGMLKEEVFNRFLGYSFEIIMTRWLRDTNSHRTDFNLQSRNNNAIKGRLNAVEYLKKNHPFIFPCSYSVLSKSHHWNKYLIGAAIEAEQSGHTNVGFHNLVSSIFSTSSSTTSTPKDIFQVKFSEWPYYEAPLLAAYVYLNATKRKNAKSLPIFKIDIEKKDTIWQKWLEKRFLPDMLRGFQVTKDNKFKEFKNPSIRQWHFNSEYKKSPVENSKFSQSTDMLITKNGADRPYCVVDAKNFDMQKELVLISNPENTPAITDLESVTTSAKFSGPFHQIRSYMDHYDVNKGIIIYPIDEDQLSTDKQTSELKMVKVNLFEFQKKKVLFLGFSIIDYFNKSSEKSIRSIIKNEICTFLEDKI